MAREVRLEGAAQEFANATAKPPFLFDLGPEKGRRAFDEVQSSSVAKPAVAIEDRVVPGGPKGQVSIRIVRPEGAPAKLPAVVS